MVPTPRAVELAEPLGEALARMQLVLDGPPRFDPSSAKRVFTVATTDYGQLAILPRLLGDLGRRAPGIHLSCVAYEEGVSWKALAVGEIDLFIGFFPRAPASHLRQKLFDDHMVCVVRAGHPEVKGKLTLKQFIQLQHLVVAPPGSGGGKGNPADLMLKKRGLTREIVASVPNFLAAPLLVAQTDYVTLLPSRVAAPLAASLGLQLLEPPMPCGGMSTHQVWHRRADSDPAHQWFRNLVQETAGIRAR
jgi:DNA-binding transcriptional LysR family regulator